MPELRLSIVDGKVLADSEDNPGKMDNHADRPEVQQVMNENKKYWTFH